MRGWQQWPSIAGLGLLFACLSSCGPPPPPPRPRAEPLYAQRPHLAGLDTSPLRGRRILIDPGHGGRFGGAEGVDSTREADVNLGVGLYLWGLLHDAGAEVSLTRASDRDLLADSTQAVRDDLAARVARLDSLRPEVFLSLHHNSNAALDRERNAIETYYRLDDDGPSYDLARAIHAQLTHYLGIAETRLLPGNYFVLRNAGTTAVLGEASYLSNPRVEAKLRLADKQMLEAEAYFLGLLDYFRRGAASIVKVEPEGDTLRVGGVLRFRLQDPSGDGLDPLAAEVWVDGLPVTCSVDAVRREVVLSRAAFASGTHLISVRARNVRGNAARGWNGAIVVHASPRQVLLAQEPDPAAPGSELRLRIRVLDGAGLAVEDGCSVSVRGTDVDRLVVEPTTRAGEVLGRLRLAAGAPRLQLQAGDVRQELALRVQKGVPEAHFGLCVDARDGKPLAEVTLRSGTGIVTSDRTGCVRLGSPGDSVRTARRGYVPWRGTCPADATLRLEPLFGGCLHDVRFVLDPAGNGQQASTPDPGTAGAPTNHDLCRLLADLLRAAGAHVTLTRGIADEVSDVERLRVASREHAEWYLRLDTTSSTGGVVLHYPGSSGGERLATALAPWLERRLGVPMQVHTDTQTILQQTPCPAIRVGVPWGAKASLTIADDAALRQRAYALFVGIRAALDPAAAAYPPVVGNVQPAPPGGGLAMLDGAEVVPLDEHGGFRFECVTPGRRLLALELPAAAAETEITVSGTDTTRVQLAPPSPHP